MRRYDGQVVNAEAGHGPDRVTFHTMDDVTCNGSLRRQLYCQGFRDGEKASFVLTADLDALLAAGLALRKEASDHECSVSDCPLCAAIDAWDALVSGAKR